MGAGVCFFDRDNDGLLDLYFTNGHPLPPDSTAVRPTNILYANNGDGIVRSPANYYIQFRLSMERTKIRRLIFEYAKPSIALEMKTEIDPARVEMARETAFTLSVQMHMRKGTRRANNATGFRRIQVRTPAHIAAVDRVLVDDIPTAHSAVVEPGVSFTIFLGRRVDQDGSFLQVAFRGSLFQDGTPFEVRALDRRSEAGRSEEVYQIALEDDIDPTSGGGSLVVRLKEGRADKGVIAHIGAAGVFTPNRDGANDTWVLAYDLLKLSSAVPVRLDIFALTGRHLRRFYSGVERSGHHTHTWDGSDDAGLLVAPGLYIYRIHVDTDEGAKRHQGTVGVVY